MTRRQLFAHGVRSALIGAALAGAADALTVRHEYFDRSLLLVAILAWIVAVLPAALLLGTAAAAVVAPAAERGPRAPRSVAAAVVAICVVAPAWFQLLVHWNVALLAEDTGREALLVDAGSAIAALLLVVALAAFLRRLFERSAAAFRSMTSARVPLVTAAVVLAIVAATWRGGWGFADPPAATPPSDAPDVVVILIDTLRRDHLAGEGYAIPTSPNLDTFARRGARFSTFVSQSCYTKPSVASLFTSQLPAGHRVGHLTTVLAEDQVTLAERFHEAGWRTGIFCANTIVAPEFGFAQGAEVFRTLPTELVPRTKLGYALFRLGEGGRESGPLALPRRTLAAGERWLLGRRGAETLSLPTDEVVRQFRAWRDGLGGEPYFAYLHVMEPHSPYEPDPIDVRRLAGEGAAVAADPPPAIAGFPPLVRGEEVSAERLQAIVRAYDAEIAGVDRLLADFLAEVGRGRPTIVAITADHGEEFFEHGGWRHGQSLHAEMLDVPFLIAGPGVPQDVRVASPAQLVDIGPTLLDLCAQPVPEGIAGRSLVPAFAVPPAPAEDREHVAEIVYGDAYWSRSLARGPLKLIVSRLGAREATQLFDIRADPAETRDLAAAEPAIAAAMRARLDEIVAAAASGAPPGQTAEFDPVTRERLKALGYVQ